MQTPDSQDPFNHWLYWPAIVAMLITSVRCLAVVFTA